MKLRHLGLQPYGETWTAMRDFTDRRGPDTEDELWLLEHPPIFTLGQAGRWEHVLDPGEIPVLQVDRGGQVTYHGPGQLILYVLLDLRRRRLGVKSLVHQLENAVIALLRTYGISGTTRPQAPGVYVNEAKIAALGLRIRKGCSFHGLALNVDIDLTPFSRIHPCGYAELSVTSLAELGVHESLDSVGERLADLFTQGLDAHDH